VVSRPCRRHGAHDVSGREHVDGVPSLLHYDGDGRDANQPVAVALDGAGHRREARNPDEPRRVDRADRHRNKRRTGRPGLHPVRLCEQYGNGCDRDTADGHPRRLEASRARRAARWRERGSRDPHDRRAHGRVALSVEIAQPITSNLMARRLGDILNDLFDKLGIRHELDEATVVETWAMIAGPEINAYTE